MVTKGKVNQTTEPLNGYVILGTQGSIFLVFRPGEGIQWFHVGDPPHGKLAHAFASASALMEIGMKDAAIREDCFTMARKQIGDHETELHKFVNDTKLNHVKEPLLCYITLWSNGALSLVLLPGDGIHWVGGGDPPPEEFRTAIRSTCALVEAGMHDPAVRKDCFAMAEKRITAHEAVMRKTIQAEMVPA